MRHADRHLSPFERCPNEILLHNHHFIVLQALMPKRDILALRLTSHRLSSFFTPYALNKLTFPWIAEEVPTGLKIREHIGIGSNSTFVPAPDAFLPAISSICISLTDANNCRPELQTSVIAHDVVDQLQPFWVEIERYTCLKELEVCWREFGLGAREFEGQSRPIYQITADKLLCTIHQATDGKLNRLSWFVPFQVQSIPKSFCPSFELQDLYIYTHYYRRRQDEEELDSRPKLTTSLLGDLVLHNPGLRYITINGSSPHLVCEWEELFPVHPKKLAVEEIEIDGFLPDVSWPVRSPSHSAPPPLPSSPPPLPMLPDLRVLRLDCDSYTKHGINLDRLWAALKNSCARLTHLTLGYGVSDLLAEYLSSYSGLSKCDLSIHFPPTSLSDSFL
ncbi:hypothetical protein AX16_004795 [Volvariella volvacea WC 439]|nr:hypothetical protein AX16_004795 [Volvariella volvacea WC 439]